MEMNDKLKLAMLAGAYAIRNNHSLKSGCFVNRWMQKTISWTEAEKTLLCTAEGFNPDECEIEHE